jgi:allantoicase
MRESDSGIGLSNGIDLLSELFSEKALYFRDEFFESMINVRLNIFSDGGVNRLRVYGR